MTLKSDAKFKEKLTCGLKNDMGEFGKFSPEHRKFQNWDFHGTLVVQSRKCMSLKFTGNLCAMTMKNDTNTEEELTCCFKTDMTNLTNFDLVTQKSLKFAL